MFKFSLKRFLRPQPQTTLSYKSLIGNMMKITMLLILLIFIVLVIGSLVNEDKPETPSTLPPELPMIFPANSQASGSATIRLYFRYTNLSMLAMQSREIQVNPDERKEVAVLKELIKGPASGSPALESTIHPQTSVVKVEESGDTLLVTLSPDYLRQSSALPDDWAWDIALREEVFLKKRLATWSIINTLTGMGDYANVQILIDTEGTKTGKQVSWAQMGFEDYHTPRAPFEPMAYQEDVVLNAANTVSHILQALIEQDFARINQFIGLRDKDNVLKPSMEKTQAELAQYDSLERFVIVGQTPGTDGKSAVIRVDLSYRQPDGSTKLRKSVPIFMRTENEIWVISYSDLLKVAAYKGTE